jgi:hypothetical protein
LRFIGSQTPVYDAVFQISAKCLDVLYTIEVHTRRNLLRPLIARRREIRIRLDPNLGCISEPLKLKKLIVDIAIIEVRWTASGIRNVDPITRRKARQGLWGNWRDQYRCTPTSLKAITFATAIN